MHKEHIIHEALALPVTAIDYHVSQYLAEKFPAKALVEGNDGLFNVETYAQAGHCSLETQTFVHDQDCHALAWARDRLDVASAVRSLSQRCGYDPWIPLTR